MASLPAEDAADLQGVRDLLVVEGVPDEDDIRLFAGLRRDVEAGIRHEAVIERSKARIALYEQPDTVKVDVSEISPERIAAPGGENGGK